MAKGVAEVQQGAAVVGLFLAFVVADHGGLEGAGAFDRLGLGVVVAVDDGLAMALAPGEERGVADQAGLGDFGVSRLQLTRRQGGEGAGVGEDHFRLVEGADQILAVACVDAGLAADRGIDLGQQGGRNLHEGQAAQGGGGGKPGQVADHAAAEGDDGGAALDAKREQPVDDILVDLHAFGGFATGDDDRIGLDRGFAEAVEQGLQVQVGDVAVGDDDGALLRQARGKQGAGAGQQVVADDDVRSWCWAAPRADGGPASTPAGRS